MSFFLFLAAPDLTASLDSVPSFGSIFDMALKFGLGVAVLLFWVFYLLRDIKDYKEKERLHAKELLDLSKENIATMGSLTKVVEAVAPAIAASSQDNKHNLELAINQLREHIANQCSLLERALKKS